VSQLFGHVEKSTSNGVLSAVCYEKDALPVLDRQIVAEDASNCVSHATKSPSL
jgi:hypothetical protein